MNEPLRLLTFRVEQLTLGLHRVVCDCGWRSEHFKTYNDVGDTRRATLFVAAQRLARYVR